MAIRYRVLSAYTKMPKFDKKPDHDKLNVSIGRTHFTGESDKNLGDVETLCKGEFTVTSHRIDDTDDSARRERAEIFAEELDTRLQALGVKLLPFASEPAGDTWNQSPGQFRLHPVDAADERVILYQKRGQSFIQLDLVVVESNVRTM